ncbi:hypothetical protein PQJ75_06220 [Rhodoplanes sp. TEM]|uniref:Uncharacterized protein n=1 Tax=Rhodoplanes tepidamans TaxID=200616 RepID=A0ABT5J7Q0_RHOTP|nr:MULTISPECIES: hypothetical protein [Rhodoplanes]MDC7785680.1 hypothetical protein [Rhodoplanes tepidamans]MDC7983321.1 hypothetical protein [Rhodoplanes sp. TEM]MDQ0354752.1 hypothetical protein [Rhodoplanes tepidamans]
MTPVPVDGRERPAFRRAAIGFRPCDLVPFPLLVMMVGCNVSAAMMLANPFVTAAMITVFDAPWSVSRLES